jgi:hypothetical protein
MKPVDSLKTTAPTKSSLRVIVITLWMVAIGVLFSSQDAFAFGSRVPTASGNYCMDEAHEWLAQTFGTAAQPVTIKRIGSGRSWHYWVSTGVCSGYVVMQFTGAEGFDCTIPQYGSRVRFLEQIWGEGDCERVLPEVVFPRR